jgi:DNA-binding transcriptional ArsR family regulator
MIGDADIAALGSVLADQRRARILLALGDGRALPASVLAAEAGVAPSTASEHLGKLVDARLLTVEPHGRHRYFRLAGPEVGRLLETLAGVAPEAPVRSLRQGTRAQAVRAARTCYDHLAGQLGCALMDALLERGILAGGDGAFDPGQHPRDRLSSPGREVDYRLTDRGREALLELGVDPEAGPGRRPLVQYCVDWSEQRHHLAGALGARIAARLFELGWIRRAARSRAVHLTEEGVAGLRDAFGVELGDGRDRPRRAA